MNKKLTKFETSLNWFDYVRLFNKNILSIQDWVGFYKNFLLVKS